MPHSPRGTRGVPGQHEISMEEFKKELKIFDKNGDGRISVEEIRVMIRHNGGWFSKAKAKHVVASVDSNLNGLIDLNDENETSKLVVFAMKELGLKVVHL